MTIASAINRAVTLAKQNMGDLVFSAVQKKKVSKTYNTATGRYVLVTDDVSVEGVFEKFSYQEMQSEDFVQTDIKVSIFNPDNTLSFDSEDSLVIGSDVTLYAIRKIDPVRVGGFTPVFTLVLRK